ncbi:MAG: PKD domain-containing protein, partial [Dehalococcoidia bacterium]|nr:PKD domain-containing protein [Dehalococcoidia bacterium]
PGPVGDGCTTYARLAVLTADGNRAVGEPQVLIQDWCMQFVSHSIGEVRFGPDGALYVSGGEGANHLTLDYGQRGNPCGDAPSPAGVSLTLPNAEGGALRAQSVRGSGSVSLGGSVIRVDPDTGAALPTNPLINHANPNARRIVAHGFRNPIRFDFRPGTNELWVGSVGDGQWETISRVISPTASPVFNGGWPCYEGADRHPGFDALDLTMCETLYAASGAVTPPYFQYRHREPIVAGESCPNGSSSITGLAFYPSSGLYPSRYHNALFFADFARGCIWAMLPGVNGLPDPNQIEVFASGVGWPVSLRVGPTGELFFIDIFAGTIYRVRYTSGPMPPTAVASADRRAGPLPLTVQFSASQSTPGQAGDTLTYSWDLNGDGVFGDSSAVAPTFTYTQTGTVAVSLRVTDQRGATSTASVVINAGNEPPTAIIDAPASSLRWRVGDTIAFSGRGVDPQTGDLAGHRLQWTKILHHCPQTCHTHFVGSSTGLTGAFVAPDHEYPSYIELRLRVTAPSGLEDVTS